MIRSIVAILSMASLMVYQYFMVKRGINLSELYFISISLSISAFCFLSMKKGDNIFVSSLSVLCGSFFIGVVVIYLLRWVMLGDGSTNYYTAIMVSTILTFIYLICYAIKYYWNYKHN